MEPAGRGGRLVPLSSPLAERHTLLSEPIGDLLNALGVAYQPQDGDLVVSALVLMKVVDEDGNVSLRTAWSEGLSWIEHVGMLHVAEAAAMP